MQLEYKGNCISLLNEWSYELTIKSQALFTRSASYELLNVKYNLFVQIKMKYK